MWYWSVAILFWQLSIDHIVNVQYKRCGFAKTRLRNSSLPFHSLPYPTRTICRRVRMYIRTLGQSRDNQTKRGWAYSMSMGLCPKRARRAWGRAPLQTGTSVSVKYLFTSFCCPCASSLIFRRKLGGEYKTRSVVLKKGLYLDAHDHLIIYLEETNLFFLEMRTNKTHFILFSLRSKLFIVMTSWVLILLSFHFLRW